MVIEAWLRKVHALRNKKNKPALQNNSPSRLQFERHSSSLSVTNYNRTTGVGRFLFPQWHAVQLHPPPNPRKKWLCAKLLQELLQQLQLTACRYEVPLTWTVCGSTCVLFLIGPSAVQWTKLCTVLITCQSSTSINATAPVQDDFFQIGQ